MKHEVRQKNIHREMIAEAESAAGQRNIKHLYEISRTLSSKNSNPSRPIKYKDADIILGKDQQKARWAKYFKETLYRPAPSVPLFIPPPNKLFDINANLPSKIEIVKAIKPLKTRKVAGQMQFHLKL